MLDDEGCLNAFLPTDLFLSTATPLALERDLEFYDSTLGIVVLNGNFPRYWVVGNTLMSPTQWILQVFDFKSL